MSTDNPFDMTTILKQKMDGHTVKQKNCLNDSSDN